MYPLKLLLLLVPTTPFSKHKIIRTLVSVYLIQKIGDPDNKASEQQDQAEPQIQSSSANGISHPGLDAQNAQHATPPQFGTGPTMV